MCKPVVIELGAGANIATVRHFSQRVLREHGGRLVRINPRASKVGAAQDVGLAMSALDGLSRIDAVLDAMDS